MKRLFDLAITIPLIFLFLPVMALLAVLVRLSLGHPVLFQQQRPGLKGEPFVIYKFRTMTDQCDKDGNLLSDADRLTVFGKFLRSTSLDELPELFNVVKGEMSLVGPRPLLMQYLDRYTPEQMRRHEVRPGITGWAQVNGRNAITWEEKFEYDVWYVNHWSLWLDVKILWLTAWKILKREGVTQPGQATIEEFRGNSSGMTKQKEAICLFGASGHAKVIIDILERSGRYHIRGLFDDNRALWGQSLSGYPIIGGKVDVQSQQVPLAVLEQENIERARSGNLSIYNLYLKVVLIMPMLRPHLYLNACLPLAYACRLEPI